VAATASDQGYSEKFSGLVAPHMPVSGQWESARGSSDESVDLGVGSQVADIGGSAQTVNSGVCEDPIVNSNRYIGNACVPSGVVSTPLRQSGNSAVSLSLGAPPFVPFTQVKSVIDILCMLNSSNSLSLGIVRQVTRKAMAAVAYVSPPKPSALNVREMFIPEMFRGGDTPLPLEDQPLNVVAMDGFHVEACTLCSRVGTVHDKCYWCSMRLPVQNGWVPPLDRSKIWPQYTASGADGNHKSASMYPATVRKEIDAQLAAGICSAFPVPPPEAILCPLGVIIKKSDAAKAKVLTGVVIKDQTTLDAANVLLSQQGLPKVKGRPITDATAPGVNQALLTPPFSNSGIGDAIALITPGCFMGKLDVSRYFHQFPLAPSSRWLFWFVVALIFYRMNRAIFGAAPCPYFTSGYGAEVRSWVVHKKIPCTHFCDDWFTAGKRRSDTERFLKAIAAFFIACGFSMAFFHSIPFQLLVSLLSCGRL
jgi:hypothetical protein